MENAMHKRPSTKFTHPAALFIALFIDIVPALFFLQQILSYNSQANNYDIEKNIFLLVIPVFIGMNFLLTLVLYSILTGRSIAWGKSLFISIGVLLSSYPLLYVSSYVTPLFQLKYPEQELLSMWIFTCSAWLLASACGAVVVFLLHRRPKRIVD
jgi:hypothetical protein